MTTTTRTTTRTLDLAASERSRAGAVAFGFLLAVLSVAVLAAAFALGLAQAYAGRVMPGVAVAGVELSGLDRPAAETRLREALPALADGDLTLSLAGDTAVVPYGSVGRDYDIAAMLDAAFAVGRTGAGPVVDAAQQVRSLVRGTEVAPAVRYDAEALRAHVTGALAGMERAPVDATVTLDAEAGAFTVTPGATGRTADIDTAVAAAAAAISRVDAGSAAITIAPVAVAPAVSTEAAEAAAERAAAMTARPLMLTAGEDAFSIVPATLRSWIAFAPGADGAVDVTITEAVAAEAIEALRGTVDQAPRNASFKTANGRITDVVPGVEGRALDTEASVGAVTAALARAGSGSPVPSVELALATVEPDVTTEEAEAVAPKMRRISTWTTYFEVNETNFFGKNISVPTDYIDGTVVAPGDWFSFWETVGILSPERGFGPGGAIINGRTERTGALAGGICSCSTTLFNAALRAGYEIGERRNHYYYISRYPRGLDATVFKSDVAPDQDMTFRNDTDYPVLIRGINGTGSVTFELYSVDPGRRVVLSDPVVRNRVPAKDTVEYTSSLPSGQSKRIEFPADGFDSWVTRRVYEGDALIHDDTFHSHYARVDGVVLVGR